MKKRGKIGVTSFVLITLFLLLLFEFFYFSVGPDRKTNITSLAISGQTDNSNQRIETGKENVQGDDSPVGNRSFTGFFTKFKGKISGADTSSIIEIKELTKTNYIILACIVFGIGICIVGIFYSVNKKRKSNALSMEKLNNWVDRAHSLGYTYNKIQTLLELNGWKKNLIKKALKKYK